MTTDIIALNVDARQLRAIDAFAKRANVGRHDAARFLLDLGIEFAEKPGMQKQLELRKAER
jgi:hypothetical protein